MKTLLQVIFTQKAQNAQPNLLIFSNESFASLERIAEFSYSCSYRILISKNV